MSASFDGFSASHIQSALSVFAPTLDELSSNKKSVKQAAVCLILSELENNGELSLLMIRRSVYKGDPWSGHMAFPGGRVEESDNSTVEAALRELSEELSVSETSLNYVGRLSDIKVNFLPADKRLSLSSFVYIAKERLEPIKNYEVDSFYWIPLSFFVNAKRKNLFWMRKFKLIKFPYYRYHKKRVWGLSLAMIDELFDILKMPLSDGRWRERYKVDAN